jgi:vancomycin resistance protein VanJ
MGSYFAPWLMMATFVALAVAWIGRRRWLARLLAVLCLVFVVRYWPVLLPHFPDSRAAAGTPAMQLRVMTFNVHFSNRDVPGVARMIRAEAPDVIALQEFTSRLATPLLAELAADYPYALLDDTDLPRLGLISRFPLIGEAAPPGAWRTQVAAVETPAGTVMVWNLHSASSLGQRGWQVQRETFAAVANRAAAQADPAIVLGDLNTTDQAENYQLIAGHLTDVQRAAGWGFGFTFPGRWLDSQLLPAPFVVPVLCIDHILVSEDWTPKEIHVVAEGPGSDHLPVVATLQLSR